MYVQKHIVQQDLLKNMVHCIDRHIPEHIFYRAKTIYPGAVDPRQLISETLNGIPLNYTIGWDNANPLSITFDVIDIDYEDLAGILAGRFYQLNAEVIIFKEIVQRFLGNIIAQETIHSVIEINRSQQSLRVDLDRGGLTKIQEATLFEKLGQCVDEGQHGVYISRADFTRIVNNLSEFIGDLEKCIALAAPDVFNRLRLLVPVAN